MFTDARRREIATAVCKMRGKSPKAPAIVSDDFGKVQVLELWEKVELEIRPILEVIAAISESSDNNK